MITGSISSCGGRSAMRSALLSVAGMALFGTGAFAAEPDDAIARLGSRSFAEREAATQSLDALGTAALPALQKARGESTNAEVQLRIAGLIERIRRRADSIALIQVKPISFEFRDRSLSSAVADLRLRTGIPLVLDPTVKDKLRPVTFKAEDLLPWQAVERFCEAAGLRDTLAPNAKPESRGVRPGRRPNMQIDGIQLVPGEAQPFGRPGEIPVVLVEGKNTGAFDSSGGLRIRALPMTYAGSGEDRNVGEVKIHFDVAPQPALNWIQTKEIRIGRATTSTGRELRTLHKPDTLPAAGVALPENFMMNEEGTIPAVVSTRSNARAVPVTFRADERDGKSLRTLEGLIVGDIAKANRPIITIDDLAAATGEAYGYQNSTLTIISLASDPKSGSTKLVLRIGSISNLDGAQSPREGLGGRLGEYGLTPRSVAGMRFSDAEGRPMKQPVQQGSNAISDGFSESTEITLRFGSASSNIAPKPVKLVVWGTEIVTVEVPFKLKDVPLE